MNKFFLFLLLLTNALFAFGQEQEQPNIVLLFVDDYGWADVGYRNEKFRTPNIDQLKKDGLDFSRAYIPTPTCSPSRAALLTGKESVRMEMTRHIYGTNKYGKPEGWGEEAFHIFERDPVKRPSRNWLPLEEITYAEKLKEYGYYNAFIGKWHLGQERHFPIHQGFDEQYRTNEAGHPKSYIAPFFPEKQNNLKDVPEGEYLTDILTDKAADFIKTYDKKQPFMLSMWYFNVHSPFIGRKDLVEEYDKAGLSGKDAKYAAMVTAMDESVGNIRKALTEKGIADNTVVLFLSDQGGAFQNGPLSGGKKKNTLGEGGARVPFIAYYPGVTNAGEVSNVPVQSIDIFPTLIEIAAGKFVKNKAIQGKSLLPIFKSKKVKARNLFFFRSYEDLYAAVIRGDWKLKKYHSGKFEMYNLAADIGEQKNLIDNGLKEEKKLKKALLKWEKEAVPAIEEKGFLKK